MKKIVLFVVFAGLLFGADKLDGKKLFEKYCWGCHHQTAMAFGPPFSQIAAKRTKAQIMGYITSPKSLYKEFGYKRSVMTQFHLKPQEIDTLSDYILSFKGKK